MFNYTIADDDQWRSQDIADARAQHGHTMFVRTCAREVQTGRGGGVSFPKNFGNLPDPVLWPYHTENVHDERMKLVILWIYIAILRRSISRPLEPGSRSTTLLSAPMIRMLTCTGGARPRRL